MKTPFPTISAEIADLQNQIEQLDLPAKAAYEARANSALVNFKTANPQRQPMGFTETQCLMLEADYNQARARRADAERETSHVTRDMEHLTRMLNADDKAAQALAEITARGTLADAAQTAVNVAQTTHAEIENLVSAESLALDAAKSNAAVTVLAQVKAGKQGKLPPVSRERLDALVLALETADAELMAAQESLAEGQSNLADAQHAHGEAMADRTACTLHTLSRDYAKALNDHQIAVSKCGRAFDPPDLDALVRQLERESEMTLEVAP